jgi:hypothetical protein
MLFISGGNMEALFKLVFGALFLIAVIAVIATIGAYPTKWLVNYVFTDGVRQTLFGMPRIDFRHALALNFVCGILFKGSSSSSSKN